MSPLTAFFLFFFITFLYSEELHHRNISMKDQINQTTALKYSIPLLLLYIGNKLSSQSHQSLWVVQIQGPYSRNVLFLTSLTSQTTTRRALCRGVCLAKANRCRLANCRIVARDSLYQANRSSGSARGLSVNERCMLKTFVLKKQ